MKFKFVLIAFFVIFSNTKSVAQLSIINSQTKDYIAGVQLVSPEGFLVGTTDLDGKIIIPISFTGQKKYKANEKFIFQQLGYYPKAISPDSLLMSPTIEMISKITELPEVVVPFEKPNYMMLKVYYRSYSTQDGVPRCYSDGIVDYVLSLKKNSSPKIHIIECRSFDNDSLNKLEEKRNSKIGNAVAIPYLRNSTIIELLNKGSFASSTTDKSDDDSDQTDDSSQVSNSLLTVRDSLNSRGDIRTNSFFVRNIPKGKVLTNLSTNRVEAYLDVLAPKKTVSFKLFGLKTIRTKTLYSEIYRGSDLDNIGNKDLIARSENYCNTYKHKKDKDSVYVELLMDAFVIDKQYLTSEEKDKMTLTAYFGMPKTNYNRPFWLDSTITQLPAPNINIEQMLTTKLQPYIGNRLLNYKY